MLRIPMDNTIVVLLHVICVVQINFLKLIFHVITWMIEVKFESKW